MNKFPWQSFIIWSDLPIFFKKYASIPLCQLQFAELNSTFKLFENVSFKSFILSCQNPFKGYSYLNI
ncbi:unnamed protein product [Blepharisma stoltei]|uniref:Uncharacterized protein n=1 Tax=Blepharisma stoltei TaxID=1481888 RepID=A0AAU9JB50_9CILI|nr:unnamed protein product [Blepharisma stoltei]